jgi:hypothetical protein
VIGSKGILLLMEKLGAGPFKFSCLYPQGGEGGGGYIPFF